MPACLWCAPRPYAPPQESRCPGKGSIAIFVAHLADELSGTRLPRRRVRQLPQRLDIDTLFLTLRWHQPRNWFAAAGDAHGLAGFGALNEFAEMRLRLGNADIGHAIAPDQLDGHLRPRYLRFNIPPLRRPCAFR